MKTILCVVLLIAAGALSGTILVVNNLPDTDPDFTTLAAAHAAAAPGDTLYICGSNTSYGNLSLTKPLTLIGTGYFLGQNPYTQANPHPSTLVSLTFNAASAGSLVSGLSITNIVLYASNITIKRNYISTYYPDCVVIGNGVSNIALVQNYISRYNSSYSDYCIQAQGNNYSLYIANNIILNAQNSSVTVPSTSFATIEQNVFYATGGGSYTGTVTINNTVFQNNIMRSGTFVTNATNTVNNNIGNSSQFGTANGNLSNVDMATVFNLTGSPDGLYTLLPGSPALGAGVNGVNCGAYGGPAPYVLSGMPEGIPSIYEFTAPVSGFTLPALIKAHAH